MLLGSQWCCSAASARTGRHKACVSWTTPSCCCGSCIVDSIRVCHALRRSSEMMLIMQFLPECDGVICEGIVFVFLSIFFDQFDGLGCQVWVIVPSTPTRTVFSGDFS